MQHASLSQQLFDIERWLTFSYLGLVVLLLARLEMLKAQRRLPTGVSTVTSPLRWRSDLWAKMMGAAQRERQGRVFRVLFTDQHKEIGDPVVTGLIYLCRAMLGVVVAMTIAMIVTGFLRRPA